MVNNLCNPRTIADCDDLLWVCQLTIKTKQRLPFICLCLEMCKGNDFVTFKVLMPLFLHAQSNNTWLFPNPNALSTQSWRHNIIDNIASGVHMQKKVRSVINSTPGGFQGWEKGCYFLNGLLICHVKKFRESLLTVSAHAPMSSIVDLNINFSESLSTKNLCWWNKYL